MLSAILIEDKYHLHIINEIASIIGLLRDLIYTYEYKHDDLSYLLYFYYRESSTVKHLVLELKHYQTY
jgi:hypothetical protein